MKAILSESNHCNAKWGFFSRSVSFILNLIGPALLLFLTLCTTSASGEFAFKFAFDWITAMLKGIEFAFSALIILAAHALGHYIQARLQKVKAYTPYFIPGPFFIGSMGAYVKMQWPIADRKALIKIFATGPICGFIAAWIILIIGLLSSKVADIGSIGSSIKFGGSLIMHATSFAIIGDIPATKYLVLHPMSYAGWLGLFYNFCQLLPIGRFDGGRLIYAVWGCRVAQWVSFLTTAVLILLGLTIPDSMFWLAIAMLGLILTIGLRRQYPPEQYDQPLSKSMVAVLVVIVAIFIGSFTPVPLSIKLSLSSIEVGRPMFHHHKQMYPFIDGSSIDSGLGLTY